MVLWAITQHISGESNETFVSRRALWTEAGIDESTLDRAIADLKDAGLLRVRKQYQESGKWKHFWIIQRERLKELVGDRIDDALLIRILDSAKTDGEASLEVSAARVQQVSSRLKSLAGDIWIEIEEGKAYLYGTREMMMLTVTVPASEVEPQQPMTVLESIVMARETLLQFPASEQRDSMLEHARVFSEALSGLSAEQQRETFNAYMRQSFENGAKNYPSFPIEIENEELMIQCVKKSIDICLRDGTYDVYFDIVIDAAKDREYVQVCRQRLIDAVPDNITVGSLVVESDGEAYIPLSLRGRPSAA